MTSKDVMYDELVMVQNFPCGDSSKTEQQNQNTQVELKISLEDKSQASDLSSLELTDIDTLPTFPPSQITIQYSITRDRPLIEIRPPQKYRKANFVPYALNVANKIDFTEEPTTYTF